MRPALLGSLLATPIGIGLVAPFIPDLATKLLFAVLWAGFGLVHLRRMSDITAVNSNVFVAHAYDQWVGLFIGIAGGIIASMTGVGIDMLIYAALIFHYRTDLKIAIPTSVILMAVTSVIGIASCLTLSLTGASLYRLPEGLFFNWLAAAPVVALGAPLGAAVVKLIPRNLTLAVVSVLCLAQFVWTLFRENTGLLGAALPICGVIGIHFVFESFYDARKRNCSVLST